MRTRIKITVLAFLVAALLGSVLVSTNRIGPVVAQTEQPQTEQTEPAGEASFVTRLAAKLGIEQSNLEAALTQVRRQKAEEALNARLERAVAEGRMTQEQADQYKAWRLARPTATTGGHFRGTARFNGLRGLSDDYISRIAAILEIEAETLKAAVTRVLREIQDESLDRRLQQAVEQGKLTQEQADEYMSWWQARPDTALRGHWGSKAKWERRFGHRMRGSST